MSEIRENLINSLNEFNELIINLDKNQIKYFKSNSVQIEKSIFDFLKNDSEIVPGVEFLDDFMTRFTNVKYEPRKMNQKGLTIRGFNWRKNEFGGLEMIKLEFFRKTSYKTIKSSFFSTKDIVVNESETLQCYLFPSTLRTDDSDLTSERDVHNTINTNEIEIDKLLLNETDYSFLFRFFNFLNPIVEKSSTYSSEIKSDLNTKQNSFINELDKDGNGQLDTIQINDDFVKIVKKHQSKIVDIDKNYVQQFVKISNYQKQKRTNLQSIFEYLSKTENEDELGSYVEHLKEQVHSYELIILHSLNMVTSLINDDMFTFYEIHESFDKLGMFNSNHENEVSQSLKNIDVGISVLMNSINKMERNIVSELNNLSYITQESFSELSNSVSKQLSSIDSSIKFNNLLTGIQTYQMYKVNKNTKSLRG
jgi:hypothetical protein